MKKRKIRNGQDRPKAFVGELVAAGINAATTMAAAGIQAAASKEAAKQQADAIKANAEQQAAALREQNTNAIELQKRRIEFDKQMNEQKRIEDFAVRMNEQIGGAASNYNAMMDANRIRANKGKLIRNSFPLRGSSQMSVTDGGVAIPVKQDVDGMIYLMVGDTHNESHISPDGKKRTGIGIDIPKFTNKSGKTNLEVQNGELVKTYNNGNTGVLSTQRIAGINPVKSVMAGGDFNSVLNYQENNKRNNNINNNRKKAYAGIINIAKDLLNDYNILGPKGSRYIVSNPIEYVSVPEINTNVTPLAKQKENYDYDRTVYNTDDTESFNLPSSSGTALGVAGISALGNFGGALISHLGNRNAGRRIEQSQMEAANIMSDAYNRLQTIDPNSIKLSDYTAAHAMGVYRAPIMNTNTQWTMAARMRDNMVKRSNRNSVSSASAFAKNLAANQAYLDYGNQAEFEANKYKEQVRNQNVATANQIAIQNTQMDNEARRAYIGSKLGILQYNNDTANQRILGAAGAQAGAKSTIGNTWANIYQANAQGYANALGNTVNTGLGTWNQLNNNRMNLGMVMAGADKDARDWFMKNYTKYLRG